VDMFINAPGGGGQSELDSASAFACTYEEREAFERHTFAEFIGPIWFVIAPCGDFVGYLHPETRYGTCYVYGWLRGRRSNEGIP